MCFNSRNSSFVVISSAVGVAETLDGVYEELDAAYEVSYGETEGDRHEYGLVDIDQTEAVY